MRNAHPSVICNVNGMNGIALISLLSSSSISSKVSKIRPEAQRFASSNLDNAGVKSGFGHRTRNVLQKTGEDLTRLVRLNDRVHPTARGAITNVGLFFVVFLNCRAQFFERFR